MRVCVCVRIASHGTEQTHTFPLTFLDRQADLMQHPAFKRKRARRRSAPDNRNSCCVITCRGTPPPVPVSVTGPQLKRVARSAMQLGARSARDVTNAVLDVWSSQSSQTARSIRDNCSILARTIQQSAKTAGISCGRATYTNVKALRDADFQGTETHLTRHPDEVVRKVVGRPRTIGTISYHPESRIRDFHVAN